MFYTLELLDASGRSEREDFDTEIRLHCKLGNVREKEKIEKSIGTSKLQDAESRTRSKHDTAREKK